MILHGTDNTSTNNWFPWLKRELEQQEYKVWSPDLPGAEKPSVHSYNEYIFANKEWRFNEESILVGHSSGAVAILGLLQALPDGLTVDTCVLVGAFKDNLGWDSLSDLFLDPFDFQKIRSRAKRIIFIHSDNDPYCPLEHVIYLREQLEAELHVYPKQKHFSIKTFGDKYKEFPVLLNLLSSNTYTE